MRRLCLGALAAMAAGALFAESWPDDVVSFQPERTWKSGDEVTVRVTPPDMPESVAIGFYAVCRDRTRGVVGRRQPFEFEGMPTKLVRTSKGVNVWTATFRIPFEETARTIAARDFVIDLRRYGADTHFDGVDSFACPHPIEISVGAAVPVRTGLRLYDFGSDESAVYPGAKPVSRTRTPEEFSWVSPPQRWERGNILQLDALVHDWVASETDRRMTFRLKVPDGRWHVAATFGAIGKMCWENAPYLPVDVRFDIQGETVFSRSGDEAAAFRYREHEAEPDEDIYDVYIKPVLCDFETTVEARGGELEFSVLTTREGKRATIDSLAVWPEGDREASQRYACILERRKTAFNETIRAVPPTDRYGVSKPSEYERRGRAMRAQVPVAAALENPFDWVLMDGEPPATVPEMTVSAACGEKACGGVLFRSDVDATGVSVRVDGLPRGVTVLPLKIMNFRHCYGTSRMHWIAPNHLMPGPRNVRRGYNYGWMIRFGIPTNACPGTYQGNVSVVMPGRVHDIPLRLRIHPFELPELEGYRIGVMGSGEGSPDYFRFAREELGATTVHLLNVRTKNSRFVRDADGHVIACAKVGGLTPDEIGRRFRGYRDAGFAFPAPYCGPAPSIQGTGGARLDMDGLKAWSPEWKEAIRLQYGTLLACARSNGCETVTLDLGGEYGSDSRKPDPRELSALVKYLKFVKGLYPEILMSFRCNCIDSTKTLFGLLDVVGVRGRVSWEYADEVGRFGQAKPVYVYSVGGRFQNGVGGWYHGATGSFREWIAFSHGLEYNDFICEGNCGCAMHFEAMPAPKAEGSYNLTQRGEAFRTGVDDLRYLKLLEHEIAAADPSRATQVAAARNFLAFVRAAAGNVQRYYDFNPYGGPFRQDGGNDWPYLRLDYVRELCARHVVALRSGISARSPMLPKPTCGPFGLMLNDGPLNRAFGGILEGGFALPSGSSGNAEVVLEGEGVREVLPAAVEPARIRQHYWKGGTGFHVFAFDSGKLKAGSYGLSLVVDGRCVETSSLMLVDP